MKIPPESGPAYAPSNSNIARNRDSDDKSSDTMRTASTRTANPWPTPTTHRSRLCGSNRCWRRLGFRRLMPLHRFPTPYADRASPLPGCGGTPRCPQRHDIGRDAGGPTALPFAAAGSRANPRGVFATRNGPRVCRTAARSPAYRRRPGGDWICAQRRSSTRQPRSIVRTLTSPEGTPDQLGPSWRETRSALNKLARIVADDDRRSVNPTRAETPGRR